MPERRSILRTLVVAFAMALLFVPAVPYAQKAFRVYYGLEGDDYLAELPDDFEMPAEFVIARLMFPSNGIGPGSWSGGDWRQGGTSWAVDYPRADRRLAAILRRLTRIDVRSVEQPVNLDDGDDVYYW